MIKSDGRNGNITFALADVFKKLWAENDSKSVTPFKFKKYFSDKNTMFKGKNQEDIHEFLLSLLNSMHEEMKISGVRVNRATSKLDITHDISKVQ